MNCLKPLKSLGFKFLLLFLVSTKLLAAPIFQVSSSTSNVLVGINSKVTVAFTVKNVSGSTLTTGNIIPKLANARTASVVLSTTDCVNQELGNGDSCTDSLEITGLAPGANTLNFWVYAFNGAIGSKASVAINIGAGGHSIGGSIEGLTTDGLQIKNNDTDELIVINGATDFQFATPVPTGGKHHVTVSQASTGQTCTVNNGTGINVVSNVTDIHITCSDITFTIGGHITGLTKEGLKLKNNGDDELEVPSGSASFEFDTPISYGSGYAVTVSHQPEGQTCTVNHASGTYVMADVTSVSISCSDITYTVGGNVSGLTGTGLTLQNNSGDDLVITNDGNFEFDTPITHGSGYTVTVKNSPAGQICTVSHGTGSNVAADVTDVDVNCINTGPSGCSGNDGACLVFVSSSKTKGDLKVINNPVIAAACDNKTTGILRANCICQTEATNSSRSGVWHAWISDSSTSAKNNIIYRAESVYVRADEQAVIIASAGELITALSNKVSTDYLWVWTGTSAAGLSSGYSCNNWETSASTTLGTAGRADKIDDDWTARSDSGCHYEDQIYCMQG